MLLAIVLLISSWPNFKHVTVDDSQTLFSRPLWLMKEFGLNWNHLWLLFNVVYWFFLAWIHKRRAYNFKPGNLDAAAIGS